MVFNGISKVFSTKDDRQYETIGAFWDEFSKKYGREKLRGLGYNWTTDTIECYSRCNAQIYRRTGICSGYH